MQQESPAIMQDQLPLCHTCVTHLLGDDLDVINFTIYPFVGNMHATSSDQYTSDA